jgi:hypothetical protein
MEKAPHSGLRDSGKSPRLNPIFQLSKRVLISAMLTDAFPGIHRFFARLFEHCQAATVSL